MVQAIENSDVLILSWLRCRIAAVPLRHRCPRGSRRCPPLETAFGCAPESTQMSLVDERNSESKRKKHVIIENGAAMVALHELKPGRSSDGHLQNQRNYGHRMSELSNRTQQPIYSMSIHLAAFDDCVSSSLDSCCNRENSTRLHHQQGQRHLRLGIFGRIHESLQR